ncbi:uncharacterized protein LOC130439960 isoform X2 [Triplophysa dalaica]|uniref:uncharacterized protein LOC130439960 isoform X2 n=1 Tax=Triplophysa dalaica TaxID=1582913 RepID=UPI0024DF7E4F|nr:uncharacterized protein LOC130439960 isoform X2 [Triplophysa dalaica]
MNKQQKNSRMPHKRKKNNAEFEKVGGGKMSRDRFPLIGSSGGKTAARPALSTPQGPPQVEIRRRDRPPISSATLPDSMAPWEGSSHSDSSFASFPTPLSPLPPAHSYKPVGARENQPQPPPTQIKNTKLENGQSARVKRKPLPPRHPPRPPRLPPLRQITSLSFSRSFTFSFFELPVHQSARNRAERLKDLTVLLKQFQY